MKLKEFIELVNFLPKCNKEVVVRDKDGNYFDINGLTIEIKDYHPSNNIFLEVIKRN